MKSIDPALLAQLAPLDALLQEGSVTAAARRVGLSTPAMSHALARLRERFGDPLLVRSGRGMTLTPRAEALKPRIHEVLVAARAVLEPERPFVPAELDRSFTVVASDYVLTLLGGDLDRLAAAEAPRLALRFAPNTLDDPRLLREGAADLAVGIYGDLPQEMRSRQLLTDRFVCAVREGHPGVGKRLSLEQLVRLPHLQVAPRGQPGGYLDDVLREQGHARHVARAVPYFLTAAQLASQTDYLLVLSERVAVRLAPTYGLRLLEIPLPLRPYALSLVWHPRFDGDAAHRWLRELFARAAKKVAGDVHDNPRTRLDATDPASGQTRRRPRKARPRG